MDDVESWLRATDALSTAEAEGAAARAAIELGRVLESNDRIAEARQLYQSVWDRRTRHRDVLEYAAHAAHNLGWLCSRAGRPEDARTWHEQAYELRSSGPAAEEAARLSVVCLMMLHWRAGKEAERKRWWQLLLENSWGKVATRTSDPPLEMTPERQARLQAFLDQWVRLGRSTHPANREGAERGIERMYALTGRRRPRFIWCDSPAECLNRVRNDGPAAQRPLSLEALTPRAFWQFWPYIRSKLRRSLAGTQLGFYATNYVDEMLWRRLGRLIWEELADRDEPGTFRSRWRPDVANHFEQRGPHDAGFLVHALFCRDELGVHFSAEPGELLACFEAIVRSCGSWWPLEDVCLVGERPSLLEVDAQGRLHAESGCAIAFRDGFGFCAWHGLRIPTEWILHRDRIDPALALTWRNVEQRRALGEIIGAERLLASLPHSAVDEDRDPQIGTLLCIALPGAPAAQFLKVRCATGRDFILRVPPHVTTARQANAWTYALDADQYTLEVRT